MLPTGGAAVVVISQLAATGLWGFGVRWLAVALLCTISAPARFPSAWAGGPSLPVRLHSRWPPLALARVWDTAALEFFGVALYTVLVGFWILVTANTLRGLRNGQVWKR